MTARPISLLTLGLALIGCTGGGESSPGNDLGMGGHEASTDAEAEASPDGAPDAPMDVAADAPLEEDRDEIIAAAGGDACAEYAYAHCMMVNACLESQSMRRCTPAAAMTCRAQAIVPDSGMDDAALRACAEARETDWCGRPFECQFASQGTREEGASCHFNGQCDTGFCSRPLISIRCAADVNGTVTCSPPCGICAQRFGLGESCDEDARGCEAGLACSSNGDYTSTCSEPKPAGAPCGGDNECVRPLECSVLENACGPRPQDHCFEEEDCPPRLYCASGGCSIPRSVGLGEECNAPSGFPLVQCDDGYCAGSITKTCTSAVPVGGACSGSAAPCEPVAHCHEGVCQPIDYSICL